MSLGRFVKRGYAFQGWAFAGLALANLETVSVPVVDATPMTGWRSTPHSRSLVNRNDKAVVATEHSRVVVYYPEVRR